jgi:glycosyltransferase involved in cell wall biosynthesis
LNKPVIVSNIPCNRWILGNAPVGIYLRGTSPREIADGVREFLVRRNTLNPTLGREMAAAFSVKRIAEMLERQMTCDPSIIF